MKLFEDKFFDWITGKPSVKRMQSMFTELTKNHREVEPPIGFEDDHDCHISPEDGCKCQEYE